jgi:hypothetical protein
MFGRNQISFRVARPPTWLFSPDESETLAYVLLKMLLKPHT